VHRSFIFKPSSCVLLTGYYSTARKTAVTITNIPSSFETTGIFPFNPDLVLNSLRPTTSPTQITLSLKGDEPIVIELYDHNPQTIAQATKVIKKFLTNTPEHQVLTICGSLLASNAILFKTNSELVANARKKKSNKKPNTRARYLTNE
jgi:hypothetical protein